MGTYLNPGIENFKTILNGIYVDKTGVIEVINNTINTTDKLTCISRPRRFGKSFTAKMLCAYYGQNGKDARELFFGLDIYENSRESFDKHFGKYNVIYLDITGFISENKDVDSIVEDIRNKIKEEIRVEFDIDGSNQSLTQMLAAAVAKSGTKFFFIIDEWDALYREHKDKQDVLEKYINFLREIFKNGNVTDKVIAGAFMTGILPIKKYGHQSAISDFREYTMIQPSIFSEYVGFTKDDINKLAESYTVNKSKIKKWYDGYSFPRVGEIFNPNSVIQAIRTGVYDTYWSKTETYNALLEYINMDADGLQADLIQMLGGNEMPVDTSTFQNDMTSIKTRDDVLSLLIHLGYLAYDTEKQCVRIPNEEIRQEFISTIKVGTHEITTKIIKESDQLIVDTIEGDEDAVARAIQNVHDAGTFGVSPLFYNDEQALRSVVKFAYISCANNYMKVEELPSGHGYADIAYIPNAGSRLPALVIELKMDETSESAIEQIKRNNYPKVLENLKQDIVLCAISYNHSTKEHSCKIEKIVR